MVRRLIVLRDPWRSRRGRRCLLARCRFPSTPPTHTPPATAWWGGGSFGGTARGWELLLRRRRLRSSEPKAVPPSAPWPWAHPSRPAQDRPPSYDHFPSSAATAERSSSSTGRIPAKRWWKVPPRSCLSSPRRARAWNSAPAGRRCRWACRGTCWRGCRRGRAPPSVAHSRCGAVALPSRSLRAPPVIRSLCTPDYTSPPGSPCSPPAACRSLAEESYSRGARFESTYTIDRIKI